MPDQQRAPLLPAVQQARQFFSTAATAFGICFFTVLLIDVLRRRASFGITPMTTTSGGGDSSLEE